MCVWVVSMYSRFVCSVCGQYVGVSTVFFLCMVLWAYIQCLCFSVYSAVYSVCVFLAPYCVDVGSFISEGGKVFTLNSTQSSP